MRKFKIKGEPGAFFIYEKRILKYKPCSGKLGGCFTRTEHAINCIHDNLPKTEHIQLKFRIKYRESLC